MTDAPNGPPTPAVTMKAAKGIWQTSGSKGETDYKMVDTNMEPTQTRTTDK